MFLKKVWWDKELDLLVIVAEKFVAIIWTHYVNDNFLTGLLGACHFSFLAPCTCWLIFLKYYFPYIGPFSSQLMPFLSSLNLLVSRLLVMIRVKDLGVEVNCYSCCHKYHVVGYWKQNSRYFLILVSKWCCIRTWSLLWKKDTVEPENN